MRPRTDPAALGVTWALAVVFLFVIDVGVTHSRILWGKTSFEHTHDIGEATFAQTYIAARKIYAPDNTAPVRVAVLGDSRTVLGASEKGIESAIRRLAPGVNARVYNLAIFGATVEDMEVLSRHLDRMDPSVVIVTLDYLNLLPTYVDVPRNGPARLLNIGWYDGPLPPRTQMERVDRWLRTIWPLYRFREFARAALTDRFVAGADSSVVPDANSSPCTGQQFPFPQGSLGCQPGKPGTTVEVAYDAWRQHPTLDAFVTYLSIDRSQYVAGVRNRTAKAATLSEASPGLRILDRLLARLAERGRPAFVMLMPENPLLGLDATGQYHNAELARVAAELIGTVANRHAIPVVDGRRWMPAEAFFDFDHLFPDLSEFQTALAQEILHALGS